jgi:hypothetical protein
VGRAAAALHAVGTALLLLLAPCCRSSCPPLLFLLLLVAPKGAAGPRRSLEALAGAHVVLVSSNPHPRPLPLSLPPHLSHPLQTTWPSSSS